MSDGSDDAKVMHKAKMPEALRKLNSLLTKEEMALALDLSDDPACKRLAILLRGKHPESGVSLSKLGIGNVSLAALCFRAGISYKTAIETYKQYKRSEAVIAAAQRLPAIVEGMAQDATPSDQTCAACEGSGLVSIKTGEKELDKRCIPCEGTGRIRIPGDATARKQILEMMELAGRGMTNINAQGANVVVATGEGLEETLKAARESKSVSKLLDIDGTSKVQ